MNVCFADIKCKLKVTGATECKYGSRCRNDHLDIGRKLSREDRRNIEGAFARMQPGAGRTACEDTLKKYPSR